MFLIYTDDLVKQLEHAGVTVKISRDDVKVYLAIGCAANGARLQNVLNLPVITE